MYKFLPGRSCKSSLECWYCGTQGATAAEQTGAPRPRLLGEKGIGKSSRTRQLITRQELGRGCYHASRDMQMESWQTRVIVQCMWSHGCLRHKLLVQLNWFYKPFRNVIPCIDHFCHVFKLKTSSMGISCDKPFYSAVSFNSYCKSRVHFAYIRCC